MRSMTGFGRGTSDVAGRRIVVEIKTVNHRFLEVRSRIPHELGDMDIRMESRIRRRLSRGFCNVHLSSGAPDGTVYHINTERLSRHLTALAAAAEAAGLPRESLMPLLANVPDVFEHPLAADDATVEAALDACDQAIAQILEMRTSEGAAMAIDIAARISTIGCAAGRIESLSKGMAKAIFQKYRQRIRELLDNPDRPVDDIRVETEAAVLAEKMDITEEITRLRSHLVQMEELLHSDAPAGRSMEFLVQEMGREINTIGAKTELSEVTHLVVSMKGELEKIRELVQNVE